jgi:hypothetical protein
MVRALVALLVIGAVASCDDDDPSGLEGLTTFRTTLNGGSEVPANASTATGAGEIAVLGPTVLYRVDVAGLTNGSAAHIHGPATDSTNAGILVNLCGTTGTPACPAGANYTGVFASGTATNLSISFDSLMVLLNNGSAYINVHTNDNAGAQNTGPGDLAAGEIRGQLDIVD